MKVRWTAELATGVERIDEEHKELIDRMDQFLDACRQGLGKERAAQMLDFLEQYAISHFAMEEGLMVESAYPSTRSHRAQHTTFRRNVQRIREVFDSDGPGVHVIVQVNRTVIDWMLDHIRTTDKALGSFIVASGAGA